MANFSKGILIIEAKTGCLDYCFAHDIMYLNSTEGFDAWEINKLYDLGFYIDDTDDCFISFS